MQTVNNTIKLSCNYYSYVEPIVFLSSALIIELKEHLYAYHLCMSFLHSIPLHCICVFIFEEVILPMKAKVNSSKMPLN